MGNNTPKKISYKNKVRIGSIREKLIEHFTNGIQFSPEIFSNQFTINVENSNVAIKVICPNDQICGEKIWAELIVSVNGSMVSPHMYGLHKDILFVSLEEIIDEITRIIDWYVHRKYIIKRNPIKPFNRITPNPFNAMDPKYRRHRNIRDPDNIDIFGVGKTIYESNYGSNSKINAVANRGPNLRSTNDSTLRTPFESSYKFKYGPNSELNNSDNTDWSSLFGG